MDASDFKPTVDYFKTIKKEKLVYKRTMWGLLGQLMDNGVVIIIMGLILIGAFETWRDTANYGMIVIALPLDIWMVFNLIFLNKLVKVEGVGLLRNKEDVMNTLKSFYDDATFSASKENIIRDVKFSRFGSGRVITVVLNDNVVYFNRATLGRGSIITPLAGLYNYYRCKEIAEYFQNSQARQEIG